MGGWRIVHTMGSKITRLSPPQGVCAEASGSIMLFGATWLGIPLVAVFALHLFGAMGAGDVKLFAAIGSVVGVGLVVPTFVVVVLLGGVLAVVSTVRSRAVLETAHRVLQIFIGFLPGWQVPRFAVPADRRLTIPYGVAITFGSLISLFLFRA